LLGKANNGKGKAEPKSKVFFHRVSHIRKCKEFKYN
jgi:hypothetical protein